MFIRRKHNSFAFIACIFLLAAFARASYADTLVMPQDLVDFAHAKGCEQINNFYERPGMVNPPYVYGWLPGEQEDSVAFWCKKTVESEKPYNLMIKARDSKALTGCSAIIEWWNPPGGLSIETRSNLALGSFRYVAAPKQNGPVTVIPKAKVIVSYDDGLTDVFYCHKGQWLVGSAD